VPLDDCLDRLCETVTGPRRDLEELLDHLLETSEANTGDDTCIVGVQLT
jgi:hypothetical protein